MEVEVLYGYEPKEEDELRLQVGDVITKVVKQEAGWFKGTTLSGDTGVFPDNFVKIISKDGARNGAPDNSNMNQSSAPNKRGPRRCRAVFSYAPQHEDELTLKEGDELTLLQEVEEGWWKGELRGQVGMFPSNFVEEIIADDTPRKDSVEQRNKNNINANISAGDGEVKPKSVASRGYGVPADLKKELTKKLQSNATANGKTPGTPVGALHPPQQQAGARSDKTKAERDRINTAIEKEGGGSKPAADDKHKSAQRVPSVSGGSGGRHSALNRKPSSDATPPPLLPPKPVRELARVLYPYKAEHEDELNLQVDDVITLVSKDLEDRGWWKGELGGKVGVFPDNFVQIINADEQPKPPRPDKPPTLGPHSSPTTSSSSSPTPMNDYSSINGSTEKLQHLNQQRPKGPNRRPPSAVFKENMRNSSESDSNGGISLGSPSNPQKSPGIGAFSKEGSSDSPASKSIAEEAEGHIPPSSILLRVNSKKSAISSSGSSPAAAPSSGSPAPARSPHTKRTSLLGGTTGTQPAVPWLQELNAKQQRKSQLLELEREGSFAPTAVSSKPVPPTPKKPGDTQSNKSPVSGDVIRPVSFHPVKPAIEEKHPQQPDLISTTRKISGGKVDVPSSNVSSTVDGPSKLTDVASKTVDKPTKVSGGLSSGVAKDASPSVGATAAMVRQLQQQQQQQPTLSSSSRGSIISVSSIASSHSSSSSSNVQQNKPSIEPAIAPSAPVLAAPVQPPPSAPTQPPPAQVLAAPGVAKAAPVPVVVPPAKVVEPPTPNTPSHFHSSSSSNAVTHAPHATLSTKPPISAPAPTAPPEVPSGSTDSAKPPSTTFKLDEVIDSVLEKVLPKVKELEGRLEDQNREHARQMQLLTEELDDERKKRACLEIELERLKRTMNNYAAHV